MAQDNVLGIQATINGKDIKQGADEFIGQVSRMEQAADKFVNELAGKSKMINGQVQSIGVSFNDVVGVISKGAAALGIAFSAQQFVTQVARTRGEFQQLEVAFTTMLGSADKASALMAQITKTAAVTPFGLQEVAGGAKSLMAYGVEAEKVNDTLVRLGDIASGLSIPLNDLVYLYGTTMTQGRMFTQDLRQFQGRGIPLADELAKQFGVTKDRVGELVTAGKVGFAELEKAIISMTSEGGKFGGLMEAQSKTIIGQWRNIEDSIESMFNEIGKSQEGVINTALEGVSLLVENYETVGRSILALVATYGTYKAALITTIVLHKSWAVAARVDAAAKLVLTAATKAQTIAQLALNSAMKANPAVLLATAVVGLGTAMWALSDHTSTAEKGLADYNAEQEKLRKNQEDEKGTLEAIVAALNGEENAYMSVREAKAKMLSEFPQLAAQFMDEKGQIKDLTGLWEEYGKQAKAAKIESQQATVQGLESELTSVQSKISEAKGGTSIVALRMLENKEKQIKAKLDQAKKDLSELTKDQNKADNQPEIKNKSYWEKKKKDAEDARDALDETKKNSEEWKKFEAEIIEADKALQQWDDPTKRNKQTQKVEDKEKEEAKKRAEELLSIRREIQQAEINLMKEGAEKRRKQIELDYEKEIDAIIKQKKEWAEAQGGKLTDEQQAALGMMYVQAEEKSDSALSKVFKDEEDAMREYLREFGDFVDKRKAVIEIFNEKIGAASTEGEKLTLKKRMEQELAAIDDAAQGTTSTIAQLFEDMSDKTVSEMKKIAEEAEKILRYVKTGTWVEAKNEKGEGLGKDEFGLTEAQFNTLKADPSKLKAIGDGVKDIKEKVREASPIFEKTGEAFDKLFSGDGKFDEHLQTILSGVGSVVQSFEFLGNSLSTISDALGGNFLGGIAEGIGVATEAANAAMSGAQAGAVFGPWGAAAGAAIGAISSLTSSLSKLHDKKHEKAIQRIEEQIETLEKSYEKLGEKIEEAYSNDASKLIESQNRLLEQQKVLIQQQIKEEESKKKTDSNRIKEWKEQIEDINDTIKDNKEAAKDAIFGSDLQSAIEDFASAYVDAWSAGENKAKSAKEVVKNMIKSMVVESIKAASSQPMQRLRETLLSFWSDGIIKSYEEDYLYRMIEDIQKEIDSQFSWADRIMGNSAYSQEASSKGFQSMSQETGNELNGRFTALQIAGEEIKKQSEQQTAIQTLISTDTAAIKHSIEMQNNYVSEIVDIQYESVGYLSEISKNTKQLFQMNERLGKIEENTRNL